MMQTAARSDPGWRIDRRTFLKIVGGSAAGMLAAEVLGPVTGTSSSPAAAAIGPVEDLALALEFDQERIFRFVAERIRYEPYAGVLRGAEGTLMARAGNSADQAALLAALLKASGIECRFAQGAIDAETARTILASGVTDIENGRLHFLEAITGAGEGGRPIIAPEPDAEMRARIERAMAAAGEVTAWAEGELAATTSLITSTLAESGITLPAGFTPMPDPELQGHVWVQIASGPAWLDLDPSVPDTVPGDAVAGPAVTHDEMPDELRHRLTFQVIGETMAGGSLKEQPLLEVVDFADAIAGLPIGVMNIEREGVKAMGANITGGLEGATTYLPCVVIGEQVAVGPGAIRFGGDGGADPFGVVAAGTPGPREGEPTAEWVQVTIASPGAQPVVVRREIFDRIGPAARASGEIDLAALETAELVELEPGVPRDFMPAQRSHWLTVHAGTQGGQALGDALRSTEIAKALANVAGTFHVVREAAGFDVGLPAGVRTFPDAPNLVALTADLERMADGEVAVRPLVDIWHRSYGTTPVEGTSPTTTPAVLAGVVPHIAERLMAGDAVAPSQAPSIASVGAVIGSAVRDGVAVRAIISDDQAGALPYPPDARARLRASLADGWVALAPEHPIALGGVERVGWWLVDPVTGRTIDQMDDGGGESELGYVTITYNNLKVRFHLARTATCASTIFFTVVGILEVYTGIYMAAKGDSPAWGAVVAAAGGVVGGASAATGSAAGC